MSKPCRRLVFRTACTAAFPAATHTGRPAGRHELADGPAWTGVREPMYVDYTPQQQTLRDELRAYFTRLMTPERRAGRIGGEGPDAVAPRIEALQNEAKVL